MLLAFAWLIINSSSINGRTGERMVLPTKLRNHNELRKRRNKKAVPLREVNLLICSNVTVKLKENQQKE
jgi:hypothetical protein